MAGSRALAPIGTDGIVIGRIFKAATAGRYALIRQELAQRDVTASPARLSPGLRFWGFSRPAVFGALGQVLIIGSDICLKTEACPPPPRALPSNGRASALDHLDERMA
jgi:hypothetical protein